MPPGNPGVAVLALAIRALWPVAYGLYLTADRNDAAHSIEVRHSFWRLHLTHSSFSTLPSQPSLDSSHPSQIITQCAQSIALSLSACLPAGARCAASHQATPDGPTLSAGAARAEQGGLTEQRRRGRQEPQDEGEGHAAASSQRRLAAGAAADVGGRRGAGSGGGPGQATACRSGGGATELAAGAQRGAPLAGAAAG